ncbi:MAG: F0F1 ATP synthase subunit B [Magnetococcales bacterium]|nr:F0F1 ATP synthase subunit B [Magnetococcales bacterium]MBF0438948.1 F0F1 ATP synthase subunit B [Magnetococcales bacterium]
MIASAYASAGASVEHAAASSGLPQFESSVFGSQIFWTVVSFALLMMLLNKYVLPTIGNILDSRSNRIAEDLQKAEHARKEGERLLTNYQGQMVAARQVAAQTLEEARQDSLRMRDQALVELNQEMAKKKNAALVEIEQAKNRAMEEVRTVAVELSMQVAEKLIAKSLTAEDANLMVQEALSQINENQTRLH